MSYFSVINIKKKSFIHVKLTIFIILSVFAAKYAFWCKNSLIKFKLKKETYACWFNIVNIKTFQVNMQFSVTKYFRISFELHIIITLYINELMNVHQKAYFSENFMVKSYILNFKKNEFYYGKIF